MKKFDNIFEQAREIIRQQWTLQDLRRKAQCTGRPEEVRQQIADPDFEGYCHCMLYYKEK